MRRMGSILRAVIAIGVLVGIAAAVPGEEQSGLARPDRERLIGAWHLVSLGEPGPDGKVHSVAGLRGSLIYTRDGHMSVQLMYPDSAADLSNDYVRNGYEASFGSYGVDEAKQIVTHHVEGSITQGLVGKDLARKYRFTQDGHLVIQSAHAEEHWQVAWEHD
jgi:Lipocalin-like domain